MQHASPSQFTKARAPFGKFILAQKDREDTIGTLAKVATTDPKFPREGDYKKVSAYLNSVGAPCEMQDALAEAELDWLAQ
jgi:uncharacterized protein YozE (UPF0346 family)